jgi:cell wall-associated NlpC family hydrolase
MMVNCCKVGAIAAVFLLASCSSAPRYRPAPKPPETPPASPGGTETPADEASSDVVEYARSFIGTPYRSGGASRKGMDCSGLVMTVYSAFDIDLPRRSIDQSRVGRSIEKSSIAPADLVFFKTSSRNPVTHVGIYIGDGRFIHASTSARRVRVDELDSDYFRRRFVVAKRVLD